jgi:hypothetical protein
MDKINNFDKIFKFDFEADPTFGSGNKFELPKCKNCKYNQGVTCSLYAKSKTQILDDEDEIDLAHCSKFEPKEEIKE